MGKFNQPLPWIIGTMTAGLVVVAGSTYLILESPNPVTELEQLTQPVKQQNLLVRIQANGTIEPIQSVNISPKEPGRLVRLLVEQGQLVKQGQKLAIMENQEIQAQGLEAQAQVKRAIASLNEAKVNIPAEINQKAADLEQAKTRLFQAQARLKETQASLPKQINQAQAQLVAAESRFNLAKERTQRYQYLTQQGATAVDRFQEEANEYRNAEANLFEAKQRLEEIKNTAQLQIERLSAVVAEAQIDVKQKKIILEQKKNSAKDTIEGLKASVEAAQAQLKRIEIRFLDTIIVAPFDGIVTQKYATEGAFVTPTTSASSTASATSTSILALARGLEIIAKVPEVDIGQIRLGQTVEIKADAYPDRVFQGKVRLIAPEAIVEQNVTSFEVRIALVNGRDQLLSKMNVDVTFLGQPISNALVVPTVAIVTQEGKVGVMIPDENRKPKFQPVTLGLTVDDQTQILQGLTPQDRVFIDLPKDYKQDKPEN